MLTLAAELYPQVLSQSPCLRSRNLQKGCPTKSPFRVPVAASCNYLQNPLLKPAKSHDPARPNHSWTPTQVSNGIFLCTGPEQLCACWV